MTTTDFISQAWVKAEGTPFTDPVNSTKWTYLLTLGNYYINSWASQIGVDWAGLYNPTYLIGTVSATDTFDFDNTEVRKLSQETGDPVRILHADGINYTDYTLIPADQLVRYRDRNVCARIGGSIKFAQAFTTSDAEYNGKLYAPIYGYPTQLAAADDVVPVDDPNWLVAVVAYDVALHDILRKDIAPIIKAEADQIMAGMLADNEAQANTMAANWQPFSGYLWEDYYSGHDYGDNGWL
jgi:hypothetical protein